MNGGFLAPPRCPRQSCWRLGCPRRLRCSNRRRCRRWAAARAVVLPLVTANPASTLCPIVIPFGWSRAVSSSLRRERHKLLKVFPLRLTFTPVRAASHSHSPCSVVLASRNRPHIKINRAVGTPVRGLGIHRARIQRVAESSLRRTHSPLRPASSPLEQQSCRRPTRG